MWPLVLIIIVVGGILLIGLVMFVLSFYVKVDQGKALIVNTMKKEPVVTFTGKVVIPVVHRKEIMDISLKTIVVDRAGKNGLICKDNIRADIKVTFFVRVNKTADDVLKVAQAVGVQRASDQGTLEELFQAKFSEALKTVGKQMDFVDLYNKRDEFKDYIMQVIGTDLNGYSLDAAAIDYLEQTPVEMLDADNILDAQGRRKIIELTADQRMQANEIERNAEKTIKKQDVEAREAILALERQQADAEAVQEREIANTRAREQAEMDRVTAEENHRAEDARIKAEQEIGIARQNSQREIEVAEQNRQRAVLVEKERVEKERMLEEINRERAVELSRIEKEKALEVERKNIADVMRERVAVEKNVAQEEERIKDLRATMEAERLKSVAVTQARQEAEQAKIKEVELAEAAEQAAAHNAKEKLILAEAEQAAAEKEAQAAMRRAEGTQATSAAEGLAAAKVREADALAQEKEGLARVRVQDAEAQVIAKRGEAEGAAMRSRMEGEAAGLTEKAAAMARLDEESRAHEEFRLRLEQELQIQKDRIAAQITMAQENAQILAQAFKSAKIDIVGGDGQFFDRFVKAVSFGKSIDAAVQRSETVQTLGAEYLQGDKSLPEDLKAVLTEGRFDATSLKDLMSAGVLARLLKNEDPDKVRALAEKAKELGFGDSIAGWLNH
ncbi:MAG: hypothetical protein ACOCXA_00080 [Planctomycetota bacterium]